MPEIVDLTGDDDNVPLAEVTADKDVRCQAYKDTVHDARPPKTGQEYGTCAKNVRMLYGGPMPKEMNQEYPPMLYQIGFVDWALRLIFLGRLKRHILSGRGGLLADEMGLGKTYQSALLIVTLRYYCNELDGPVIIVAPKSIVVQWVAELGRFAPCLEVYAYYDKTHQDGLADAIARNCVVVASSSRISSDFAEKRDKKRDAAGNPKKGRENTHFPVPFNAQWGLVVHDEVSELTNMNTLRWRSCHALRATSTWMLSGTPLKNYVANDAYALISLICGDAKELEWFTTNGKHKGKMVAPNGTYVTPTQVLRQCMLRRMASDEIDQGVPLVPLPELVRPGITYLEMSPFELGCYTRLLEAVQRLVEEMLAELKGLPDAERKHQERVAHAKILVLIGYLLQACNSLDCLAIKVKALLIDAPGNRVALVDAMRKAEEEDDASALEAFGSQTGEFLKQLAQPSTKVKAIIEQVRLFRTRPSGQKKTIIFSTSQRFFDVLGPLLFKEGIRVFRVDGGTPDRAGVLDLFRNSPDVDVLLMTYKVGGMGINLTAACNTILADWWWNSVYTSQAIKRAHRMGQQHEVRVAEFLVKNSVEQKVQELVKFKDGAIGVVVDGKSATDIEIKERPKIDRDTLLGLLGNFQ